MSLLVVGVFYVELNFPWSQGLTPCMHTGTQYTYMNWAFQTLVADLVVKVHTQTQLYDKGSANGLQRKRQPVFRPFVARST